MSSVINRKPVSASDLIKAIDKFKSQLFTKVHCPVCGGELTYNDTSFYDYWTGAKEWDYELTGDCLEDPDVEHEEAFDGGWGDDRILEELGDRSYIVELLDKCLGEVIQDKEEA